MFKKIQKFGLCLISSVLMSSMSCAIECPAVQDFEHDVVQLPPFAFNPQTNKIHFYAFAGNFKLYTQNEHTKNDWIMVLDIKALADQITENYSSNLIQNMSRHQEQAQEFRLDSENKVQYCLYHSNDNPTMGAIAYHIPKGVDTSNQAHLQNFIRSIAVK